MFLFLHRLVILWRCLHLLLWWHHLLVILHLLLLVLLLLIEGVRSTMLWAKVCLALASLAQVEMLFNVGSEWSKKRQYVHSQLGGFSRIPCLSSLVLQLHKGLNEHTIRVEHLCANVSMLLYFFVIIKPSSAFTQECENFRLRIEVRLHFFEAIVSLFILL